MYAFQIEETNGEQSYTFDHLVAAASLSEAKKKIHAYMLDFYPSVDDDIIENEEYSYMNEMIKCSVWINTKPVNKKLWIEEQFRKAVIQCY